MTSIRLLSMLFATLAACAGKVPETRHYQLGVTGAAPARGAVQTNAVLVVDTLATDDAYNDERIVYRANPFRLDYYDYHRWSASPGVMVGNYLERALERSGRFRAVVRELTDQASVVLGGRVVAIEEVDQSKTRWLGRIVLELTLTDARTGAVLWSEQFEEHEPLAHQSPEGLARALSTAMARIAARATPTIASLAARQAVTQNE